MEEPRMPDDGKEGRGSAVAFVSSPTTPSLILISLLQLFPECFHPQRRDEVEQEEEHAARSATMTAVTIITMSSVECRLSTRSLSAPLPKCRRRTAVALGGFDRTDTRRRCRRSYSPPPPLSPPRALLFLPPAKISCDRGHRRRRSLARSVGRSVGWDLGAAKAAAAPVPSCHNRRLANITRFSEHDNDFRWESNILTYSAHSLLLRAMRGD